MEEEQEGLDKILPTSTVEVAISCRNLLGKNIGRCSPLCVVYNQPRGSNKYIEWMRTETLQDSLNPEFFKKLQLEYTFEETQPLRFDLYDAKSNSISLAEHTLIGFLETSLSIIVAAGAQGITLPLIPSPYLDCGSEAGEITLLSEELTTLRDEVSLQFAASGINTGGISCCPLRTSVYFTIAKMNEFGRPIIMHRSEKLKGSNPSWPPLIISVQSLCGGDKERELIFQLIQVGLRGGEEQVGGCCTNLSKLVEFGHGELPLTRNGMRCNERLYLLQARIQPVYTFLDYIQSGTQIHACFAIDFTSSNGDPSEPTSLHYFSDDSNTPNPYEQAINAVGNIIQDYDSDKLLPVYGFGARIPPVMAVSHNFFVTLGGTPSVYGVNGVMEAYKDCIKEIKLYGPTIFSQIIKCVAQIVAGCQNGEHYYILLIITDGIITDMESTKEAIVMAASLPLSIIIVGVGSADFTAMEELDGDSIRISSNGMIAERDIVQFVAYRDAQSWMSSVTGNLDINLKGPKKTKKGYAGQDFANDSTYKTAQKLLAKEVLAEVPRQITSYFKSKGFFPRKVNRMPKSAEVKKSRVSIQN